MEELSSATVEDPHGHEPENLDLDTSVHKLAKNSKRKSKPTTNKRDEQEKKMTGSKRKEEMMREGVDRDDSSSISTESSNTESDPSDKSGKQVRLSIHEIVQTIPNQYSDEKVQTFI